MPLELGDYASLGSTFMGNLSTIQAGGAVAGQSRANATGARRGAAFTENVGAIDILGMQRRQYKQLGGMVADASGAGLTQSGSSQDIIREGRRDAGMDIGLSKMANQEAVTTFLDKAAGYDAEAKAAEKKKSSGIGGMIGGVIGGVVGAIYGGPAGASAGASVGSGAGNFIGGLF